MGKLVKKSSSQEPKIVAIDTNDNGDCICININICQLADGNYEWDSIEIDNGSGLFTVVDNIRKADDNLKYSVLISHIIKAYYNDHQMTAIINNYLLDSADENYIKEFNDMQKIRKIAKDTAKQIIKNKLL